jgi:hypothetical protein
MRGATFPLGRVLAAIAATAIAPVMPAMAAAPVMADDTLAEQPSDLSVTVYRAPARSSGSINLDRLGGFALISETRIVRLPAGVSRLRFAGVADGIEPSSAIVTGLPAGVMEKNREGKLLSPSALMAAAVGKPVTLQRTDQKTGKITRVAGTIRSDAGGGVVFETSAGIEALRCSGLPESVSFMGVADLAPTPTLSVQVRSADAVTRTVTLSYLTRDFDWAADYIAMVAADGNTMDLGAWVTLANGNGVGFPSAQLQIVAGRVNRESGAVEPLDVGGPILAQCWPRGSTSDPPEYLQIDRARAFGAGRDGALMAITQTTAITAPRLAEVTASAEHVAQEQLGDLKLYRVPERTTVAGRQSKQVRLLGRSSIPITRVYGADLAADETAVPAPARWLLRTLNDAGHHLGLPLPSGRVAVFAAKDGETLLEHESNLRDLAVDEEVEIDMGSSPDVRVAADKEKTTVDPKPAEDLPLVPGVRLRATTIETIDRVDVSNARATEIHFELRLWLPPGGQIVRADHPVGTKNGRPIFRLTIPANETVTLRYQWQHIDG